MNVQARPLQFLKLGETVAARFAAGLEFHWPADVLFQPLPLLHAHSLFYQQILLQGRSRTEVWRQGFQKP